MKFDDVIKERHSVRRFSTKSVKWDEVIEAIDAANTGPLAGNIPVLKFIIVDNKEKIAKLAEASQQDFVSDAEYVLIVCTKMDELRLAYKETAEMYARQQAGAAIENFLLKITDMGLGSCWVGAFVEDQVKQIVSIPYKDDVQVEAILPISYEMIKTGKRAKKTDLTNVLYFNKWKEKYSVPRRRVEGL